MKGKLKKNKISFFVTFRNFTSVSEKDEIGQWYTTDGLHFTLYL